MLPLFARQSREVSALLPELYLHGLSKGDFELALRGLLGEGATLSPGSIERLRGKWQADYDAWCTRDLSKSKANPLGPPRWTAMCDDSCPLSPQGRPTREWAQPSVPNLCPNHPNR